MSGDELANLMIQGWIQGLIQGAIIMAPYIIGFCILCIIVKSIKTSLRKRKNTASTEQPNKKLNITNAYQPRALFSSNEKAAYQKLKIIADKRGYIIFAKVRLLDLLEPIKNQPNYRALFNKVQAKHVDFVLCNSELTPYIIIELDDNSHNTPKRKERDRFVDEVLTQCGYQIIHTREISPNIFNEMISR